MTEETITTYEIMNPRAMDIVSGYLMRNSGFYGIDDGGLVFAESKERIFARLTRERIIELSSLADPEIRKTIESISGVKREEWN